MGTNIFIIGGTALFFRLGQPIITKLKRHTLDLEKEVTERKQVVEELMVTKFVLDTTTDAVYWMQMDGQFVDVNDAACKKLGYSRDELLTMHVCEMNPDYPADQWATTWELIKQQGSVSIEAHHKTKDGLVFPVEIQANYVQFGDKERICSYVRDITERKQAEEEKHLLEQQLQHSQKQESLGQLSAGIAHNFNNILAIIIGYCGLTKLNYQTAEKNIPIIEKAAERAAELSRQMMAYAGKAPISMVKVNMKKKVDEIVGMLTETLPQNTVIKTEISTNITMIEGEPNQLHQVVMNLILNASEAIGTEQGEIKVSLAKLEVLAGKTFEDYNHEPIPPGEYLCLEVTDNGCGMDEATKSRLFEPFFTTKFTGRGLGMSAVLGTIRAHGGALQLSTELGKETTFKVYLPALVDERNEDENLSLATPPESWQGSGTILLVEDEESVRFIAKELLEMFGFTVLEAVNGKEALELYQNNAAEISLVFTDMGMPVMDGYELIEKLKKLNPELPIIVSSGYGDAEINARLGSNKIAGIISKPYNPDKLQEVLKSVVEG